MDSAHSRRTSGNASRGDFSIDEGEIADFSADELEFEGEMDVTGLDEFQDFDFGDFGDFDDF